MREADDEWTGLMRSALAGDDAAYLRLLKAVTPVLRAAARRGLGACGATDRSIRGHRAGHLVGGASEAADLGRQRPVRAMAVCDRPQQADRCAAPAAAAGCSSTSMISPKRIPGEPDAEAVPANEVAAQLQSLPARQREVLQSIAVDSASIKETAAKFAMTEGAGAGGAASRACQPDGQTAGTMTMKPISSSEPWRPTTRIARDRSGWCWRCRCLRRRRFRWRCSSPRSASGRMS